MPALNDAVAMVVEDDGKVIGYAGAEMVAEIVGVFDPNWGTPQERMRMFASLHKPVAEKLAEHGIKASHLLADPKSKSWGRRLRQLGWKKIVWELYYLSVEDGKR